MKNRTNTLLALICSATLLLSTLSSVFMTVFADDFEIWDGSHSTVYDGGAGTEEDPFLISNARQLAGMINSQNDTKGKYYKLTADIYINDTRDPNWKSKSPKNWYFEKYFYGSLDGDFHTVRGLYYNNSSSPSTNTYVGLLPWIKGSGVTVKNITVSDSEITNMGSSSCGTAVFAGFIANDTNAVFTNCYIDETVSVTAAGAGCAGFIGSGGCNTVLFLRCANFAEISKTSRYGSFAGNLYGGNMNLTFNNCIGLDVYTNYRMNPTFTASYCGAEGTVGANASLIVVSPENMKGASAKQNLSRLNWNYWKTTDSYPILNTTANPENQLFSFEDWNGSYLAKSLTGISFEDVAKDGQKSLCYRLPETQGNYRIPRLAMLCEGEDVCRVKSGSTYELSFWYKVDGTPANAGQFSVYAASASNVTSDDSRRLQSLNKEIVFNKDTSDLGEDGWVNAKVRFVATLLNNDCDRIAVGVMGIGDAPVDKNIYIDAVTVRRLQQGDPMPGDVWTGLTASKFAGGDGTPEKPYLIETAEQLALMMTQNNESKGNSYKLAADIKLNDIPEDWSFEDWQNSEKTDTLNKWFTGYWGGPGFRGNFDGAGYSVSGVYINDSGDKYGGLFSYIVASDTRYFKNLTLKNSYIYCKDGYAGGIMGACRGYPYGANVIFENCYTEESVYVYSGMKGGSGLFGYSNANVTVKNSASVARSAENGGFLKYGLAVTDSDAKSYDFIFYNCFSLCSENIYDIYPGAKLTELRIASISEAEKITGEAAKENMPQLNWSVWKTSDKYPILNSNAASNDDICNIRAHYNDTADTVKTIEVIKGIPFEIPALKRSGYLFDGWFGDYDCSLPFDDSNLPAGTIDIYGKWQEVSDNMSVCDYENYPYSAGDLKGMSYLGYAVVGSKGVGYSKALRYRTDSSQSNWWIPRLAAVAVDAKPYYLKENASYKVSFSYYVAQKVDTPVYVQLWAANRNDVRDDRTNRLQQNLTEKLNISYNSEVGKWNKFTTSFTSEFYNPKEDGKAGNDKLTDLDLLCIGFQTGFKTSETVEIYIDNIVIEEISAENASTITAHYNNGTDKTKVFTGVAGRPFSQPISRSGYLFEGWYTDSSLLNPAVDITFPQSGTINLYAKWKRFAAGDSITLGFSDYPYDPEIDSEISSLFAIDKTHSADGDSASLRADMNSRDTATALLTYKGYPLLVEDNARYVVSFSYKNLSEIENKWSVRVYTASPLNSGIGEIVQSSEDLQQRLTLSSAAGFGSWKRHSYNLTIKLDYKHYNALALNVQTNAFDGDTLRSCIDNVTIRRVSDDDVVCLTNTLAGPDALVGKSGEKINLPNDLRLPGYSFCGWFFDSAYTLEVKDAEFYSDTTFYAKWAKMKIGQDFENYRFDGYGLGYDIDIEHYNNITPGYNKANVFSGGSSIHRIGNAASPKKFTLITEANNKIAIGENYKITYYVKLEKTEDTNQSIHLLPTDSYFYPGASDPDYAIESVSLDKLYPGVWYKITNIVQLYSPYLAIRTPGNSSIFFDDFTIEYLPSKISLNPAEAVVPLGAVPSVSDKNNEQIGSDDISSNGTDNSYDSSDEESDNNGDNDEGTKKPRKKVRVVIKKSGNTVNYYVIAVIAVVTALVLAAVVVFIILIRKKKRNISK